MGENDYKRFEQNGVILQIFVEGGLSGQKFRKKNYGKPTVKNGEENGVILFIFLTDAAGLYTMDFHRFSGG